MAVSSRDAGGGVFGALLLLLAGLSAAQAQAPALAAFKQANAAVREALGPGKPLPDVKDPAYGKQVSSAFDLQTLQMARDLPTVMDMCDEAGRTRVAFLLFGIKKEDLSGPQPAPQLVQIENQNFLRFQDDTIAGLRFGMACEALEAQKMEDFAGRLKPEDMTPVRRNGMQQFQRGLVESISGGAFSVLDPVRPENRMAVLDAVAANIDPITAAMSKDARQAAAVAVDKALVNRDIPQDAKQKLGTIRQALNRTDCGALCSLALQP